MEAFYRKDVIFNFSRSDYLNLLLINSHTLRDVISENMSERKTTSAQTIVIIASILTVILAVALQAGGVISPSWQVVDIREFRATHHVFFL